jgi:hypothetical protein
MKIFSFRSMAMLFMCGLVTVMFVVASCGGGEEETQTKSDVNAVPIADAGADQKALVGKKVTLDGSSSTDVDGDALTFRWYLIPPAGSAATLSDPSSVKPTFDIDMPGIYVAQLIVNDGTVDSATDTVSISTYNNSAPVANAGADQSTLVGNTVTLDGSGSSDIDGDALSFSWSLTPPAGSAATLSDSSAVKPTFDIDLPGIYVAQLIVNDGTVDSAADTVSISTINSAPVAHAGPDQTVLLGSTVTLDGSSSSDADGDGLTFSWALTAMPAGSTATLSDSSAVKPTFDVDLAGVYVAQLIVNDGTVDSAADTVSISNINSVPVANAGPDQTTLVGSTVTVDGSGSSDVDGDVLTFSWSLTPPAGSAAALSDTNAVKPTFDIDLAGIYVAQLIVNDGRVNSAPDTVNISTINSAPVANAGADQSTLVGSTVTLDGSGSSDVDGDALTFSWSLTSPAGSAATLSDTTAVKPTFDVDLAGVYVAQLIVNDGTVNSAADTVSISTINSAPLADAGPDQTVLLGSTVTLDGSGSSDVDGDVLTFSWSLTPPAGSAAALSDPAAVKPTFDVDLAGVYLAQLIVNDGTVDSAADSVSISTSNNAPVADAGPDQTVLVGVTVALDGSGSSDVDGDGLTYSWSLTVPAGSTANLSDPAAINPTFDIDLPGDYVAQLIVNDGRVNSAPDTVSISTINSAPVADAGTDQAVLVNDTVILDGSGSSDADGDNLNFSWALTTVPDTSMAVLSDAAAVSPDFVADLPGAYVVQLIVNDGTVDSPADTVVITATAASGSFIDGQTKYFDDCASCHAAGSADTSSTGKAGDLYGLGELKLVPDLNDEYGGMNTVTDLTDQEILDLKAFLDDPSIAP